MIRAVLMLLVFGVAVPVHAETLSPALTWGGESDVGHWTEFVPLPAAFSVSIVGEASVNVGAALELRPVIHPVMTGRQPPAVTYLLFGRLPEGATFDPTTGRIGGRAVEAGSHRVWVSATDSTGATVTAGVTIVVT
ncbi:Ig domain-containing protein [Neorhizobium galegae]|uniref:Ig domain-containing protein n=1 Tax=Neorhizobium galegae TaxID=399 RepID=UPI002103714F|nr:Ig domain-containing protein [Neorhizobium galegae]MCQ1770365.1 Ig domain-containing protein [Neorhizobium galegae]MCQ1799686.1 Ig domain-containing protein [Neorhizobium galegae]